MVEKSFLIGPAMEGLRKDIKPWAIPEDAWEQLTNAYQFRGRIVCRPGYKQLGRLSPNGSTFPGNPVMGLRTQEQFGIGQQQLIAFDTTSSYEFNGTNFVTLPSVMPVTWSGTNYQFFYSTNYAGAFWATNSNPGINGWNLDHAGTFSGSAGIGNSATVNVSATGNGVAVNDYVYFINLTPGAAGISNNAAVLAKVTAIITPGVSFTVTAVNLTSSSTFAWTNGASISGMVIDSMKTISGQDGIRYYGVLTNGPGWANYNPPIDLVNVLAGALLIFPYRGYLVFLNTTEGNDAGTFNYGNRARWTQIGTPYYSFPVPSTPNLQTVDITAARDDLFGKGGANDAPTSEVIVSAGFIRDILVVKFERSTWRLRFVNNAQNPFVWERVNIELGSQCTFGSVIFDKGLMDISNRGINISDGNDTSRFDEKIPDDIFQIRQSNEGLQRVYGIRTFRTRLVYWTYPDDTNANGTFPDKVLVFNYDTKNWAYFDDCFTCFGYYYPSGTGLIWNDLTDPWSAYSNVTWDSGITEVGYETIVAGNQQGFVFLLEQDALINDPSLFISAFTGSTVTSPNNNLKDGDWIKLTNVSGLTYSDGTTLNGRNFRVANPSDDPNNFTLEEFKPIVAPNASGTSYSYVLGFVPVVAGSVQINIGSLIFTDPQANGILTSTTGLGGSGTIDYIGGTISLTFNPSISSTPVYIRIVSYSPFQTIDPITTTGAYVANSGLITKISNFNLTSKIFNFFGNDQRNRINKIDFYTASTQTGQFTCNIFADSSNVAANAPLSDNPQSNIVLTSIPPYQIGTGEQAIFRLYPNVTAQTIQLNLTMADQQQAVDLINSSNFELLALMITMRPGGRLP